MISDDGMYWKIQETFGIKINLPAEQEIVTFLVSGSTGCVAWPSFRDKHSTTRESKTQADSLPSLKGVSPSPPGVRC